MEMTRGWSCPMILRASSIQIVRKSAIPKRADFLKKVSRRTCQHRSWMGVRRLRPSRGRACHGGAVRMKTTYLTWGVITLLARCGRRLERLKTNITFMCRMNLEYRHAPGRSAHAACNKEATPAHVLKRPVMYATEASFWCQVALM